MIRCNHCKVYKTYSDMFGVAAMKAHVVRCERGVATDTEQIPVLDVEPVCSRCDIRLNAVHSKPIAREDGVYHVVCAMLVDEEREWVRQQQNSSVASPLDTVPLAALSV